MFPAWLTTIVRGFAPFLEWHQLLEKTNVSCIVMNENGRDMRDDYALMKAILSIQN